MTDARRPTNRKRFGQHFLHDQNIILSIVNDVTAVASERVVEIGPGGGVLTRPLLDAGCRLTAIEIDRDLCFALQQSLGHHQHFSLINQDVLKLDLSTVLAAGERSVIVGNLPYNISTPLIMKLLEAVPLWQQMTLMVQDEVALRLAAQPGSKAYGRLSVMAQRHACINKILHVPAECFDPPPKVESAVVHLEPLTRPLDKQLEQRLDLVVRTAFSKRRKTLRNALREVASEDAFETADIDPTARAETLSGDDFERLAMATLVGTGGLAGDS